MLDREAFDLARPVTPAEMDSEPSLTLVASHDAALFREYQVPAPSGVAGAIVVNPLYRVTRHSAGSTLTLTFPTPEYAEEFGGCRRYLPDTLDVAADLSGALDADALDAALGADYQALRRRRVLIDAPVRYC